LLLSFIISCLRPVRAYAPVGRKDENQSAYRRKKMLRDTGMFLIPLSQQLVYFIVTKPKLTEYP